MVYYMADDEKAKHMPLAFQNFTKAYEMDSDNFLACLYIAHCHHDRQELDLALKYYQLVDQEKLKEFQEWRYIKLIEQIGYCHHQLGDLEKARELFIWVLKMYQKESKENEFNELPLPVEMSQCLSGDDQIMIGIRKTDSF